MRTAAVSRASPPEASARASPPSRLACPSREGSRSSVADQVSRAFVAAGCPSPVRVPERARSQRRDAAPRGEIDVVEAGAAQHSTRRRVERLRSSIERETPAGDATSPVTSTVPP
jgi:hypothetical protein